MLDDLIKERRKKLELIRAAGIDPYPARVERSFAIARALEDFESLAASAREVSLVGRLMSIRDQGRIIFGDIADESGKIQIVLKNDSMETHAETAKSGNKESNFLLWQSVLDIGDFISITGPLFKTQKGQMSVDVRKVQMASKSLLPLPDQHDGIENEELRLRKRYLDLIATPELRELFRKKTVFWETFRTALKREGFMEVETPVLQPIPGGADAEPFKTHHNALDEDFYLRISLELPLKMLLVGGYEKVFEIGRIFRNEGIDREHLQDYTQLEFYWAYHDYNDLMELTERIWKEVIEKTCGTLHTTYNGHDLDWSKDWPRIDYVEVFKKENGIDPLEATEKELFDHAKKLDLAPEKHAGKGRLIDLIYKKTVRPKLIQPSFLIDPPVEVVPLAKRLAKDPRRVERMQPVAGGTELGTGYSELNDPIDQRARFEEQEKARVKGDLEAQHLDEGYVEAMEYGMPPNTGFGVSERLFAVLMDKPIRETVFFPLMRPKK